MRASPLTAVVVVAALVLLLSASRAGAQTDTGAALAPVQTFRGPFQHAVVGSSLVTTNGTVLATAGADLTVPAAATLALARLYWMGSRTAGPDTTVTLRRPDGTTQAVTALGTDCKQATGLFGNPAANYYECASDVTAFVAAGASISGRYELSGAQFDTTGETGAGCPSQPSCVPFGNAGTPANPNASPSQNIYAGGFVVVIVFSDPADSAPRIIQILAGMRAQVAANGSFLRSDIATFDPLELSPNGGKLTHVAIEGDPEIGGNERIDLCRNACDPSAPVPVNTLAANLVTNAQNVAGDLFNETISTAFAGTITNVTEHNGFDIDTYNLLPAYTPGNANRAANQFFAANGQLHVASTTGNDMTAHGLLIVEIADFDFDGDGLSNIEETDTFHTNPDLADTDGDGVGDGVEVRGGNPADPTDPRNNITDPLDPDSDGDRLCDGSLTVAGVCTGGEDKNNDGLRGIAETDPKNVDTDGDLEPDGVEVLFGNFAGSVDNDPSRPGSQTDPLNPDTDGDGVTDGVEDANHDGVLDAAAGETDPTQSDLITDTDGDGLLDDTEINGANPTDPFNPDTDGDGILDGIEDANRDGAFDVATETDPNNPDTDDDQLCDGAVTVTGVCSGGEDKNVDGQQQAGETDPRNSDTDNDGIDDGTEVLSGNYPGLGAGSTDADPGRAGHQTDPLNADSDGDGVTDGNEDVRHDGDLDPTGESDPTDPTDTLAGAPGAPDFGGNQPPPEGTGTYGCTCRSSTPTPGALAVLGLALVARAVHRRRRP